MYDGHTATPSTQGHAGPASNVRGGVGQRRHPRHRSNK